MNKKIYFIIALAIVLIASFFLLVKFEVIHLWSTAKTEVVEETAVQETETETEIDIPVVIEDSKKE